MTTSDGEPVDSYLPLLTALIDAQGRLAAGEYRGVLDRSDCVFAEHDRAGAVEAHGAAEMAGGTLAADPVTAMALASLAANAFVAARMLGDLPRALACAEREVALAAAASSDHARVRALNNRGLAYHELNRLLLAEADYRHALEIARASLDDSARALAVIVNDHLGQLLSSRGEHQAAHDAMVLTLGTPLTVQNLGPADGEVARLNARGQLAFAAGDHAAAEHIFTSAIERADGATANVRGILASNRAEVYRCTNRPELAILENLRAIDIHTGDPGSLVELATDYVNLAGVYAGVHRNTDAADCFKRAWDVIRASSPRSRVALTALLGLARQRMAQQDHVRARAAVSRGLELYEQMRPEIAITEAGHAGFLSVYRNLLELAMYLSLHEGWTDELRACIERGKARFAEERIAGRGPAQLHNADDTISANSRDLTGLNSIVLNYFVGPNATFVSYEHNATTGGARVDRGERDLRDIVERCREEVMSGSRLRERGPAGTELSQLLFGKVSLPAGKVRQIHILPDGPLWLVPFDALPAPAWLFTEQADVPIGAVAPTVIAPSVSVLRALRARHDASDRTTVERHLFAFGEPVHDSREFSPLPGGARELDTLVALASGQSTVTVCRGGKASKTSFLSLAPAATHIHVASHAHATADDDDAFILCSGHGDDQYLRSRDVQTLSLRAELVFLSACSTSVGRVSTGEGLMSMARAFLWAGCRSVIATLWPVDDDSAADWVRLFYAGIFGGVSVAQAAYLARERFRAEHGRARTWAAFQVLGDADTWHDRTSLRHLRR
jgi:CHAT domain-containing protein/tetratricopeptide (TPR) repeat protein